MNSQTIFKRMIRNILFALCFIVTIAIFAVGAAYAGIPMAPLITADYGDLPDGPGFSISYDGLTLHGAVHDPDPNGLRLGQLVDSEDDGIPDGNALGDDNNNLEDEDGVTRDPQTLWTSGEPVNLDVVVNGCPENDICFLNGWIDWGLDGSFDGDQVFTNTQVVSFPSITNTLSIQIPDTYQVGDPVYARFRLCDSTEPLPNGCNALTGLVNNGEVEDYYWLFGPNAVELVSIEATTNYAVPFTLLAGALILLFSGGVVLAYKRNRA